MKNLLLYVLSAKQALDYKALYADMTENYVEPMEPEPNSMVRLRFRTAYKNVDSVKFISDDWRAEMKFSESVEDFSYYETEVWVGEEPLRYHFEVKVGRVIAAYDMTGVVKVSEVNHPFVLNPHVSTPDWSKGAVMYQIFTDRFFNGDVANDVTDREYHYISGYSKAMSGWDAPLNAMDVGEFYGGDLAGVIQKLPYLQGLGVEVIYFNPLFVSPSSHKYDCQDYDYIDPHFGRIVCDNISRLPEGDTDNKDAARYIARTTDRRNLEESNALFAELVEKAHDMGIRVIMDGVFNHCGSFNKWLDRECIYEGQSGYEPGAYVSADSPYRSFFRFGKDDWPYNANYDGWWGHDTLPKLNYEGSPKLYEYIMKIAAKWVSPPYNADGWRLDVAADLGYSAEFNHKFWKDFRKSVKEANPDAVIIAEHYGDPSAWLQGDEWDTVMNYDAFMEPVSWFLTGMQKHSDEYREDLLNNTEGFWGAMREHSSHFSMGELMCAMNELSNHDHSRFLTRTNRKVGRLDSLGSDAASEGIDKAVMREAVMLQMTWFGAPTIYYGDEAGLCGFTDPDNRRTYPWGEEDNELIDFHRACIRLRNENPELRYGSLKRLDSPDGVLAYARFTRYEKSIIIINNNDYEKALNFRVLDAGIARECMLKRTLLTYDTGYTTEPFFYEVRRGRLEIGMGKKSAIILQRHIPN